MRRTVLILAVLAACASSAAAFTAPNLPGLFRAQLATLHAKGVKDILLPETFLGYRKHLYPSIVRTTHGYDLYLSTTRRCHHNYDLCYVASFSARRRAPVGKVRLQLTSGVTGHYRDQKCPDKIYTCFPPTLEFAYRGWTYAIAGEIARTSTAPVDFTIMANSAIRHGPR